MLVTKHHFSQISLLFSKHVLFIFLKTEQWDLSKGIISKSGFKVLTTILQQSFDIITMEIGSRVEAGQFSKGREIFPLGVCETFIYGGT